MHAGKCLKNFKRARVQVCELVASIFHSEFSISHCTQNQPDPELKTSEFDKIPQSLIKKPEKKLQLFGLGYSAEWKARSGETSEIHVYSPRFLVLRELRALDLTRVHVMFLIVLMDSYN